MQIKSLPKDDQPRHKSQQYGIRSLSDSDLLALLIGKGYQHRNAKEIAQEILVQCQGDLHKLFKIDSKNLESFYGIGSAKAATLLAAFELGRRQNAYLPNQNFKISNSSQVYNYIKTQLSLLSCEAFVVLLLNNNNEVIHCEKISRGGLTGTIADGRILFALALSHKATGIILCHNHPSGNKKPSDKDISLTQNLKNFGKYIELPILDHLIFTDFGYFSFADEGLLN